MEEFIVKFIIIPFAVVYTIKVFALDFKNPK
jgi:hypothetical protein